MTTLYKLTSTALLSWSITTDEYKVIIEHGQYHGKKQVDIHNCSSAKLATIELERRVAEKKDRQGYTIFIPKTVPDLPMLATQYNPAHLPPRVYIQPKFNGMRCVATCSTMLSRGDTPISSMPHIKKDLESLPPGIRLDGELYCHGLTFQEHISIIKRNILHPKFSDISYNVFDLQSEHLTFTERFQMLSQIIDSRKFSWVRLAPTTLIGKYSIEITAKELYSDYEGAIIRDPESLYQYNSRSKGLQKYPWFQDGEFEIVGITCSQTGREAGAAIFICKHGEATFKARPKMSLGERSNIYRSKELYTGWWTKVIYKETSHSGLPLKPIAVGLFPRKTDGQ